MTTHRLDAGPQTVHWGFFESSLAPLLSVDSGDRLVISTVSGPPAMLPPPPMKIPAALTDIHAQVARRTMPGHICTGPVAVRGAKKGQTLQVDIEKIDLAYDWGFNNIAPLRGALPDDFAEEKIIHITLDAARMVGTLPWGMEIPLKPFFGVLAVAPPAAWGTLSTIPPRPNGGNMDNKELTEGSTLYLPIFVDAALFSVGDGHAAQGDGEVCVSAIETGLVGTFRLTVRDDMRSAWPSAETPSHFITMAFDPDLDDCVEIALRQMLDLICARTNLDRYQAYTLCSLASDLRITQVVNGNKGVHVMLPKHYLNRRVTS
jgi:acetamidase/formamidase